MSIELRRRSTAVTLAWLGAFMPSPLPLSGLHKFYLGQPVWGVIYLLLGWTQIPRVACAIEGFWLLSRSPEFFLPSDGETDPGTASDRPSPIDIAQVNALGVALRELDSLRQEGLISELEFEQKRRQLLDQVG